MLPGYDSSCASSVAGQAMWREIARAREQARRSGLRDRRGIRLVRESRGQVIAGSSQLQEEESPSVSWGNSETQEYEVPEGSNLHPSPKKKSRSP